MAEWWTKQSFCPPSGVIKPKPLASLNHLTVPVVRMSYSLVLICCVGSADLAVPADTTCFVIKALTMGVPRNADSLRLNEKKACLQFGRPQKRSEHVHASQRVSRLATKR